LAKGRVGQQARRQLQANQKPQPSPEEAKQQKSVEAATGQMAALLQARKEKDRVKAQQDQQQAAKIVKRAKREAEEAAEGPAEHMED